ncbi:MAG: NADH:ubiquinone oxidoreductase [Aquificae bacterium]|nr:NADH:ubiquinone oxidoreductase [Aquificota bacterium]
MGKTTNNGSKKPTVGIMYFTSCGGCQCEILTHANLLKKLVDLVEIKYFPMGSSNNTLETDFDIIFIEGSVSTDHDLELLHIARERSKILVAVGTCACFGGVQSSKNAESSLNEMLRYVYGDKIPTVVKALKPKPLKDYVKVDYELPGCPVSGKDFVLAVQYLLNGLDPFLPKMAVCYECKQAQTPCRLQASYMCVGSLSNAGCGAPCTFKGLGCYGCRGDHEDPNYKELVKLFRQKGYSDRDIYNFVKVFRGNYVREKLLPYLDLDIPLPEDEKPKEVN